VKNGRTRAGGPSLLLRHSPQIAPNNRKGGARSPNALIIRNNYRVWKTRSTNSAVPPDPICHLPTPISQNGLASDASFRFVQGSGFTTLRCNWPTSDPAIPGALWNNNGVLNVSNGWGKMSHGLTRMGHG